MINIDLVSKHGRSAASSDSAILIMTYILIDSRKLWDRVQFYSVMLTDLLTQGVMYVRTFLLLYNCLTHLGNGTGHRTVTMAAPLVVWCGMKLCFTVLGQAQWVLSCDSAHSWCLYTRLSAP